MARGPVVVTGADGFVGSALVAQFVATGRPFVPRSDGILRRSGEAAPSRGRRSRNGVRGRAGCDGCRRARRSCISRAGRTCWPRPLPIQARSIRRRMSSRRNALRRPQCERACAVHLREYDQGPRRDDGAGPAVPGRRPVCTPRFVRASKVDAERALAAVAAGTPLEAIVLRLPLVYGPRVRAIS